MSKLAGAESKYFDQLAAYLRDNWVPCPIYPKLRAVERSHPRGVAFWETGGALKAHHFFAVGLSKKAHLEYDADHDGFERRHGVSAFNRRITLSRGTAAARSPFDPASWKLGRGRRP